MKNHDYGCMVISLDFELMWGVMDHKNPMDYKENIKNVWKAVPLILKAFVSYNIHATWGVVGLLMQKDIDDCSLNMPELLPSYKNRKYSVYEYFGNLHTLNKRYLFASDLVKKIDETIGQEIGCHTYSHYYCMEDGQTVEQFAADLDKAAESMKKFNLSAKSIIFPRNQFNEEYAEVLKEYGYENYRGNEKAWFYQTANKIKYQSFFWRICRLLDNYLPLAGMCCYGYDEVRDNKGLNNIRSSRFLRPYSNKLALFEPVRMKRIMQQMEYAAKNNMIFHMWWHPHNFGMHIKENLKSLNLLLRYYKRLNRQYGFRSLNMSEAGEIINEL